MSTPATLAHDAAHRRPRHLPADLVSLLCAVTCALLLAYPLASLALAGLLLVNLPAGTSRATRLTLAVAASIAMSMIMGARPIDPDAPNDVDFYYAVYQSLAGGEIDSLFAFGGGIEVALPLLSLLWAMLLPALTPNGLMFCMALTSALLLVAWVEKTFYAERGWTDPALMGACILLLNLYFATQLSRQFLALVVLLYAFTAHGRARWLWLGLATSFHLTALPFYALYQLARRGPRGWITIVAVALLFRAFFWQLLAAFDIVPAAIAEKLAYYVDNLQEYTEADIASMRMIGLLGAVSLVALVACRFRPPAQVVPWLAVPWIAAVVHVLLLPIPLASLRTTLMVHSVAPGLIAYSMLRGRTGLAMVAVLNVMLLYKVATFATAENFANLRPMAAMLRSFLS
ncbi:EpsG family protein [Piscinibacter sp. XHJ-5]|uniref:EpsG family protein n=1 Tax=Piscinibacter sp. XHJ-5 TaxID=3037797 RepID=UPI0024532FF5|nr:EpsG family protein [Piscinibacter sp. XHJ-5]